MDCDIFHNLIEVLYDNKAVLRPIISRYEKIRYFGNMGDGKMKMTFCCKNIMKRLQNFVWKFTRVAKFILLNRLAPSNNSAINLIILDMFHK